MTAADRKARAEGDHYFMTRQDELHIRQMERCDCQTNMCGGCKALAAMLDRIQPLLPPESDLTRRHRQKARFDAIEAERKAKETLGAVQQRYDDMRRQKRLPVPVNRKKHYTEDDN